MTGGCSHSCIIFSHLYTPPPPRPVRDIPIISTSWYIFCKFHIFGFDSRFPNKRIYIYSATRLRPLLTLQYTAFIYNILPRDICPVPQHELIHNILCYVLSIYYLTVNTFLSLQKGVIFLLFFLFVCLFILLINGEKNIFLMK